MTLDDNVLAILANTKQILAAQASGTGTPVDLTPVLSAIAGVQTTANTILAQDNPTALPVLTSIAPANGSIDGGELITISGTGFTGATGVMFGGVAGRNLTVVSDTSITVTSPAQAAAAVPVTVTTPAGTSSIVPAGTYTLA